MPEMPVTVALKNKIFNQLSVIRAIQRIVQQNRSLSGVFEIDFFEPLLGYV